MEYHSTDRREKQIRKGMSNTRNQNDLGNSKRSTTIWNKITHGNFTKKKGLSIHVYTKTKQKCSRPKLGIKDGDTSNVVIRNSELHLLEVYPEVCAGVFHVRSRGLMTRCIPYVRLRISFTCSAAPPPPPSLLTHSQTQADSFRDRANTIVSCQ